jgi:hypothetical protein
MNPKPKMSTHHICLILEHSGRPIIEMLLMRLARAYYFVDGFSIAQAGASVASLHLVTLDKEEHEKEWQIHLGRDKENTAYRNMQAAKLVARRTLGKAVWDAEMAAQKEELARFEGHVRTMEEHRDATIKDLEGGRGGTIAHGISGGVQITDEGRCVY